jgi:hypothetical protein
MCVSVSYYLPLIIQVSNIIFLKDWLLLRVFCSFIYKNSISLILSYYICSIKFIYFNNRWWIVYGDCKWTHRLHTQQKKSINIYFTNDNCLIVIIEEGFFCWLLVTENPFWTKMKRMLISLLDTHINKYFWYHIWMKMNPFFFLWMS